MCKLTRSIVDELEAMIGGLTTTSKDVEEMQKEVDSTQRSVYLYCLDEKVPPMTFTTSNVSTGLTSLKGIFGRNV